MSNYTLTDGLINGIGGTLGGGIFLLIGESIKDNKDNAYLAFVGGAIICMVVAFCYSILSKEYPGKGGTAEYPKKVFKDKRLQLLITGLIIFGYTSLFCVYSLSAGNYVGEYMNHPEIKKIIAVFIIGLCMLFSFMPPKMFKKMQTGFVASKLMVLFGIIFGGIYRSYVPIAQTAQNIPLLSDTTTVTSDTSEMVNTANNAITMVGGSVADKLKALTSSLGVFVTYEGFEMNSIYSAGMKNPNINMPLSYFLTIITAAAVYIGLTVVTNKFIGTQINDTNSTSALIDLVKVLGFTSFGPIVVVLANIIANVSANIATIGSLESITDEYIKDAELEKTIFNKKITIFNNSKSIALLLTGILSMAAIMYGPESFVVNSGSLSFLLIFTMVCYMTYVTIEKKEKNKEEITILNKKMNYKMCKIISILGMALCSSGFGKLTYDITHKS
jgi:amino acid transporter